jgi:hypothetical protein
MEDGSLNIPDDDGTVLYAGRDTGGEAPVYDIFFVVNGDLKFRAEVLDIIVVEAEKAEHLVKVVGVGLAKLYFFRAGQNPLGLRVKLGAGDGFSIDLDDRLNDRR